MGYSDYIKDVQRGGVTPKDPFSHAKFVLDPEQKLIADFQSLVDRSMMLANVGDDKLLRLEQNTVFIITAMFDLSLRDPIMVKPFQVCYYYWKGALSMTRSKNGKERLLQAITGSGYNPPMDSEGYGAALGIGNGNDSEAKFFENLAGFTKRKQNGGGRDG